MANNYGSNGFIKTETFYENGNIESVNVEYSDKTRNLRKYSNSGILIFESWERPDGSSEVCKYDEKGNLTDKIRIPKNIEKYVISREKELLSNLISVIFQNFEERESAVSLLKMAGFSEKEILIFEGK